MKPTRFNWKIAAAAGTALGAGFGGIALASPSFQSPDVPAQVQVDTTTATTEAPDDSIPSDTMPADTVPDESVPDDTMPESSETDSAVPDDSVPDDSVPDDSVSRHDAGQHDPARSRRLDRQPAVAAEPADPAHACSAGDGRTRDHGAAGTSDLGRQPAVTRLAGIGCEPGIAREPGVAPDPSVAGQPGESRERLIRPAADLLSYPSDARLDDTRRVGRRRVRDSLDRRTEQTGPMPPNRSTPEPPGPLHVAIGSAGAPRHPDVDR